MNSSTTKPLPPVPVVLMPKPLAVTFALMFHRPVIGVAKIPLKTGGHAYDIRRLA